MSTVGLTKARREALERVHQNAADITPAMRVKLCERGLVYFAGLCTLLTSRGHAARAAPRMTQAELAYLIEIDRTGERRGANGALIDKKGYAERDYVGGPWRLTPAGRTALNNVRAAMGSPDWKEGL